MIVHLATPLVGGLLLLAWAAQGAAMDRHTIEVSLSPNTGHIEAVDRVELSEPASGSLHVSLHAGLSPTLIETEGSLHRIGRDRQRVPVEHFRLTLPRGVKRFALRYSGRIDHAVMSSAEGYGRSYGATPGVVSEDGVFLSGASLWYPRLGPAPFAFTLSVTLPADWRSISQGKRSGGRSQAGRRIETWHVDTPQEEIYLVAAPFTEYSRRSAKVDAMVLLREPDPELASRYLGATGDYIALYSELIGPYPYSKFALVENFWETGYGMPSFTLLGQRVIRLPFILHSSYPHEILHNWWGNGVYVDYASGNWAEGLTSYLADHLIQEQAGRAAEYRRATLRKYADHVRQGDDFPLIEFHARHGSASEAVGYGKTLMMFHMLRRRVGDRAFVEGLRLLYERRRFRITSYADLIAIFSTATGQSLHGFFEQWLARPGAPMLSVRNPSARAVQDGYVLSAQIVQTQVDKPFRLAVPIAVTLNGDERALQTVVQLTQRTQHLSLTLPGRPVQLDVDPEFDVFRRIDPSEVPPALSRPFGAERVYIVLPQAAPFHYRQLATQWSGNVGSRVSVVTDGELGELPPDAAVWLFGWDNRLLPLLGQALQDQDFDWQPAAADGYVNLAGDTLARATDTVVVVGPHPDDPDRSIAWLAGDEPSVLQRVARRLPHFGKYSYLGFSGPQGRTVLKGQWPVRDSPLSVRVTGTDSAVGPSEPPRLAPRAPLSPRPARSGP